MRAAQYFVLLFVACLLCACASVTPQNDAVNDPYEATNREIFQFNNRVNKHVTLSAAWVYVNYVPGGARRGITNMLSNLGEPVNFANDVLQGKPVRALHSALRFAFNSTFGIAGLFDVATPNGLPARPADFGQTLYVYGVPSGPFWVVPVIGPTTPRDFFGSVVDLAGDPLLYVPPGWTWGQRIGLTAGARVVQPFENHARNIVLRQQFSRGSVDPYITMRSVYRQQRAQEMGADDFGDE
jgi:phospholipid-binding lipoprotein MlaA